MVNCARNCKAMGYSFIRRGDTEVLLKAYHAWGERLCGRLNGMFASPCGERDSGRVLLAVTGWASSPLLPRRCLAACALHSYLPALLAGGGLDTSIDPVGLHHYLSFHAVVPAPHTLIEGVRASWRPAP